MKDLSQISFVPELKLSSLDISNMYEYTNIPTKDLIGIIDTLCRKPNLEDKLIREILTITRLIITQNYFSSQGKTYLQGNGLAMGTPTSSILSEIYLKFLENTKIYDILKEARIYGYFRYVDDILIIYNENITDTEHVLSSFNDITPSLNFTLEREQENKLNFLDLSIIQTADKLPFDIYRKPTTSDIIIPNDSCHPTEQKLAAIRYFTNRINTYDLDFTRKQIETNIVKQIIRNNKFDTAILNRFNTGKTKREKDNRQKRLAKFTYIGKERRQVTKLFKNTNVKVAYMTKNNLEKLLKPQYTPQSNRCEKNGVYQLECLTFHKIYTGQTGSPFHIRFLEHYNDFKYANNRSSFAQHILNEGHSFGPMNDIMNIVHFARKGKLLDTLEKF